MLRLLSAVLAFLPDIETMNANSLKIFKDFNYPVINCIEQLDLYYEVLKQMGQDNYLDDNIIPKDSFVDLEMLETFNERFLSTNSIKQRFNVLVFNLGLSSFRISKVMIDYTNKSTKSPSFSILNSVLFDYYDDDNEVVSDITLVDWLVKKIHIYVNIDDDLKRESFINTIPASIQFAFKIDQTTTKNATLNTSCKESKLPFCLSYKEDIIEALNYNLKKALLNIEIKCIVNDLVACYAAGVAKGNKNPIVISIGNTVNFGLKTDKSNKSSLIDYRFKDVPMIPYIVDPLIKNIFNQNNENISCFELMTSKIRYEEILREMVKLKDSQGDLYKTIDIYLINSIFSGFFENEDVENDVLDFIKLYPDFIETLKNAIFIFKKRSYQILAPMIVYLAKGKSFTLITNGSMLNSEADILMLHTEIDSFLKISKIPIFKFDIINNSHEVMHGSAFLSLVYN